MAARKGPCFALMHMRPALYLNTLDYKDEYVL